VSARINQKPVLHGLSTVFIRPYFFLNTICQYEISFQTTLLPRDLRLATAIDVTRMCARACACVSANVYFFLLILLSPVRVFGSV